MGAFLRKQGCVSVVHVPSTAGYGRGWKFPPLADARAAWEKNRPKWKWREEATNGRRRAHRATRIFRKVLYQVL
jgi:hypothetical protein